jgi:ABC-2 type transport system ATP-binding protein
MTTGLDPSARRVAWHLIDEIRERGTTVILVTHFMEEAERLADRVVVLRAGRVIVSDTPSGLAATFGGPSRITFSTDGVDMGWVRQLPGVGMVERRGASITVHGTGTVLPIVAAGLVERGFVPRDLRVDQPNLEDAFLALVGTEDGE